MWRSQSGSVGSTVSRPRVEQSGRRAATTAKLLKTLGLCGVQGPAHVGFPTPLIRSPGRRVRAGSRIPRDQQEALMTRRMHTSALLFIFMFGGLVAGLAAQAQPKPPMRGIVRITGEL